MAGKRELSMGRLRGAGHEKSRPKAAFLGVLVELSGIEPLTSTMPL
jgi:hypothetical protein